MTDILSVALSPTIDVYSNAHTILPYRKTRLEDQTVSAGGGGVNVARVIEILGGEVELIHTCGGKTGPVLDGLLSQFDFQTYPVRVEEDVRIAGMVHEATTGIEYRFLPRANRITSATDREVCRQIAEREPKFVVASGSLETDRETCAYVRIAESAHDVGAKLVLDTSGQALRETLATGKVWLVKPSIGELAQLADRQLDEQQAIEFANQLVEEGLADNVVVSFGHQGAALINETGIIRQHGIHVRTMSAVGAGDSFVAGIVLASQRGAIIEKAFRYGVAAGTAAAMTAGTQLCRDEDVETVLRTIESTRTVSIA
ncbi:MAG: 1-phosphofructokinase family hexose kinase [Rhizobiaceae bacterium]